MDTKTLCHFRTGLGNFICMTPALRALASMDPSGKVDLCTDTDWVDSRKDGMLDMWGRLPFVQNVYVFDFSKPNEVKMPKDYSVWYYAEWGTHDHAFDFFQKKFSYRVSVWDHSVTHETDYYFNIVRDYYDYKGEKPEQLIIPAERPVVEKGDRKLICLCDGSFGLIAIAKKWNKFPELARELKNYYGDKIAIAKTGSNRELENVDCFDYDFVDKLTFTETVKVIEQCDLMITTDTGLMHAGDALKKPMIVLWGGSVVKKNEPINKTARIIHLGYGCQPCLNSGAYKNCTSFRCMDGISVSEVFYNTREVLYGKS